MNDMELAEEIGRLVALSEKATQGKWSSEDGYLIGYPPKSRPNGEGITQFHCAIDPNFPRSHADGEFVAALVNWFRANIAALRRWPEPYKAVRGGGRLTYDKATRTIRDSDGAVRLELGEGDADMFCERPLSGEMVMVPRELIDRAVLWFHTLAENGMDATFSDGERTPNAVAMDDIAAQFSALSAAEDSKEAK